ncbi:aldose epimerase family protein [uncultured Roseobacter sp.]|uniref:aldose epimerase family protein n=1 Tax=uncultured Roseobacter sp. TaxID=114847 RepID=UPI002638896C|nr:aldose epimerase family protein [uncultured Roseobacter sp.]
MNSGSFGWYDSFKESQPLTPMIVLQSDTLKAHILTRGATLAGFWLRGHPRSLVLGFEDPLAFDSAAFYAGAIVGPVANRVARGQIELDNQVFQMPSNEGTTCLHSGDDGLHAQDWTISDQTVNTVTLETALPDAAIGLPGARRIRATYALEAENTLVLTITASSDCDTVMNLAHHPYWTLDEKADVSHHQLQIHADTYLPVNHQNLPTGHITPVAGSAYDFRTKRAVPVDRTLDANLCVATARSDTPRDVATLTGGTGLALHIASTEPGLQVYNGSGLPSDGPSALPGQNIAPFAGIALEPQGWPDAPNHPQFPSILLPAGAEYRQETRYRTSAD